MKSQGVDYDTISSSFLSLPFFMVFLSFWTKDDRHTFLYKEGDIAVKKINTKSDRDLSFFGSKNGKVYYYSWCKAGNKIKESNRIYFESEGEAKGRGRALSKLCK